MARNRLSAKKAGTAFETEISRYLTVELGIPVKRIPKTGSKDQGDLGGLMLKGQPVVAECKSPGKNSSLSIAGWWKETETETKNFPQAIAGVLLVRNFGFSIPYSYCIINQKMWDIFSGSEKFENIIETTSISFQKWKDHMKEDHVLKTSRRGVEDDYWYVMYIKDALRLFDSSDSLPQVYLTTTDLLLLEEFHEVSVLATNGERISVRLHD